MCKRQEVRWWFYAHVICLKCSPNKRRHIRETWLFLLKLEMRAEPHVTVHSLLWQTSAFTPLIFCLNNIHICILFYFCKLFGIQNATMILVVSHPVTYTSEHAIDYQFKHIFFKVLQLILPHCHSSLCWLWSDFFPWGIAKSPLPFEEQSNRKHLKLFVQPPWREWPFGCVVDF